MTERRYTRRELIELMNTDRDLIERYAALHGITSNDCREIIIEHAVLVDPERYGVGGVMGHIERTCERIEEANADG